MKLILFSIEQAKIKISSARQITMMNAINLIIENMNKINFNYLCMNPNPDAIYIIEQNTDKIILDYLCINTEPGVIKLIENIKYDYFLFYEQTKIKNHF